MEFEESLICTDHELRRTSLYSPLSDCGREGALRVQARGGGGAVLRHHLLGARRVGRRHAAQGQGRQALRTEEDLQGGEFIDQAKYLLCCGQRRVRRRMPSLCLYNCKLLHM